MFTALCRTALWRGVNKVFGAYNKAQRAGNYENVVLLLPVRVRIMRMLSTVVDTQYLGVDQGNPILGQCPGQGARLLWGQVGPLPSSGL